MIFPFVLMDGLKHTEERVAVWAHGPKADAMTPFLAERRIKACLKSLHEMDVDALADCIRNTAYWKHRHCFQSSIQISER
jgi:hypothetical protein